MLDDEQHLVVVRRIAERLLRRQQLRQLQIAVVSQTVAQIQFDAGFEIAAIGVGCHAMTFRNASDLVNKNRN
jgi:hypothetical protein